MTQHALETFLGTRPNTVMEVLGIQITEAEIGRVVATMPVDQRHHQPRGIVHGGVNVVLAETVASIGAYLAVDHATEYVVGVEINANHIRAVQQGTLTATGVALHQGRRTAVWHVEIRNDEGKLTCVSRCTLAVVAL